MAQRCVTHHVTSLRYGLRMADLHPEAIPNLRRARPELADLPDEVVARLFLAHCESLSLYMRDAGRAYLDSLRPGVEAVKRIVGR